MSYNESLNPNSNYPPMSQSEWDKAPWNQEDLPEEEIEVTVSITLSKNVKIKVDDYIKYEDGDIDYSTCNFKDAVENQIYLPNESGSLIRGIRDGQKNANQIKDMIQDLSNWCVDEMEVVY